MCQNRGWGPVGFGQHAFGRAGRKVARVVATRGLLLVLRTHAPHAPAAARAATPGPPASSASGPNGPEGQPAGSTGAAFTGRGGFDRQSQRG